jgi:death-on-curing protein
MPRLYYLDRGSVIDLWAALVSDDAARISVPADLVIRDEALLASALALPRQPYYPTTIDKAAVLMRSLVKNHPFVDGNKRMGFAPSLVFLWFNGYVFSALNDEVVEFVLRLAASDPAMSWQEVSLCLREHALSVAQARKATETWGLEVARLERIEAQLRDL